MFQDGARLLDVAQASVLLGWTRDAVRAACEQGDLAHVRDHLNAYRIPCSAIAAAARWKAESGERALLHQHHEAARRHAHPVEWLIDQICNRCFPLTRALVACSTGESQRVRCWTKAAAAG